MSAKYDVFISYASRVKSIAVEFEEKLVAANLKVFRDDSAIKWGDNIVETIGNGLAEARGYLLILNKDFYDRGFTTSELSAAFMFSLKSFGEKQRYIFPVLLDDYAKKEWQSFAFGQYISAIDYEMFQNNYDGIINIIKSKLGK